MFPVACHKIYKHPVPEGHRFPMEKYELLPQQLLREGIIAPEDIFAPEPAGLAAIYAVHERQYADRFLEGTLSSQEARRTGFVQSPQLVERELRLVGGTVEGAVRALETGIAFNIAGGTHHAGYNFGEGFCMLNDQAVAAQHLLEQYDIGKVLIVDLDVHQGNGTAHIFRGREDVFTFSMHGAHNYPFRKEQSSLDIGLDDGTTDAVYLDILQRTLPPLIDTVRPAFIFYQCGVDILQTDKMGRMACTLAGCRRRDELVLGLARQHRIPVQCSMGGGYSPDLRTLIEAHTNTYRVAAALF